MMRYGMDGDEELMPLCEKRERGEGSERERKRERGEGSEREREKEEKGAREKESERVLQREGERCVLEVGKYTLYSLLPRQPAI